MNHFFHSTLPEPYSYGELFTEIVRLRKTDHQHNMCYISLIFNYSIINDCFFALGTFINNVIMLPF